MGKRQARQRAVSCQIAGLADWIVIPAGPRDRQQEGTLLKGFNGMRHPLIQREQTPRKEIECASQRIQPDVT